MLKATKPFSEKEREGWDRMRKKGRTRYIVIYGVLIWGCITAILFSCMPLLFGNAFDWLRTTLSFVLFPIGGVWWGRSMWNFMEQRYALGETQLID